MRSWDIAVVGGGIVGSAIAYELCVAGLGVAVFDDSRWPGKASVAASGLLIAGQDGLETTRSGRAIGESLRLYPDWVARIERAAGVAVHYVPGSVLRVAANEAEEARLRAVWKEAQVAHAECDWIGPEELAQILERPSTFRGAIRFLSEATVAAERLLRALRQVCMANRAMWEDSAVREIRHVRGGWELVTSTMTVRAAELVLACGYRTVQWADRLGFPLLLHPVRGMAYRVLDPRAGSAAVVAGAMHAVSQAEGFVIVGSTVERGQGTPRISASSFARLRTRSLAAFPWLQHEPVVEVRCGIRPGSRVGRPVVARVPQGSGLIVACGHYRSGFALAPLTARVVREIVFGTSRSDGARWFAFPSG